MMLNFYRSFFYINSTVVLTVVRVMIAEYRKSGISGYRSSLTPEPIELKQCMSDYVDNRTPHAPRGNQGFRGLSTAQCTGVKCNPHGVDIPFFMFFCNFFAACTDQGIYSISIIFSPNDVDRRSLHSQGSHQISYPQKNSPKPHFRRAFNAKAIIERSLRQSRVNGATKMKIYSYIGKYSCACQKFSAR